MKMNLRTKEKHPIRLDYYLLGTIVGVLEIAHDITEKVNTEEALRASEERIGKIGCPKIY